MKNGKIKTLEDLAPIVDSLKDSGRKIVHCHGEFDLMHPGHIKYFEAAKKEGDVLVVTLTRDEHIAKGPGRPVFNHFIRAETIAALECVDHVAINQWPTAIETLRMLRPHVYVKGSEYLDRKKDVTGRISKEEELIKVLGGRMHFTDEITFSSSSLLNEYFQVYSDEAIRFLSDFKKRYTSDQVVSMIKDLQSMKVLVIGDTIIDEYYYCTPLGKSPKNMLVSTKYHSHERFAGGVLATANHVAGFCKDIHLVTCLGKKNGEEAFINQHLKPNINAKFFYRNHGHTVVKRRFVDKTYYQKLFEICYLEEEPLQSSIEDEIGEYLLSVTKDYDMVLVSDFGHDFIGPTLVKTICNEAEYLAVNTQTNAANTGFNLIHKYPRADYVCIDEPEARLAQHDKYSPIEDIMLNIADSTHNKYITITRGPKGASVYQAGNGINHVPVFAPNVVDTIGAGDAFLSVTSPCAAAGFPSEVIGFVGNAAGALAVQIVGNRSYIEPMSLFKFITALLK